MRYCTVKDLFIISLLILFMVAPLMVGVILGSIINSWFYLIIAGCAITDPVGLIILRKSGYLDLTMI